MKEINKKRLVYNMKRELKPIIMKYDMIFYGGFPRLEDEIGQTIKRTIFYKDQFKQREYSKLN